MRALAVDLAQPGNYITLRNAKIDMYRGSMRLAVDQWGKVEASEVTGFQPKVRTAQPRHPLDSMQGVPVSSHTSVASWMPADCSSCAATTASKHTCQTAFNPTSTNLQLFARFPSAASAEGQQPVPHRVRAGHSPSGAGSSACSSTVAVAEQRQRV